MKQRAVNTIKVDLGEKEFSFYYDTSTNEYKVLEPHTLYHNTVAFYYFNDGVGKRLTKYDTASTYAITFTEHEQTEEFLTFVMLLCS